MLNRWPVDDREVTVRAGDIQTVLVALNRPPRGDTYDDALQEAFDRLTDALPDGLRGQ